MRCLNQPPLSHRPAEPGAASEERTVVLFGNQKQGEIPKSSGHPKSIGKSIGKSTGKIYWEIDGKDSHGMSILIPKGSKG